ncbi:MAG: hypothetical protein Q9183_004440, partial [Haloplaca sp. 2 TL-2023]
MLCTIAAPGTNASLARRADNEPGDVFNRTMCYCTTNPEDDGEMFGAEGTIQTMPGKYMGYHYKFDYYNHR